MNRRELVMHSSIGATTLELPIQIRPYFASDYDHAYRIIRAIGCEALGTNLRSWYEVFDALAGYMWTATKNGEPVGFAGMRCDVAGTMTFHTDLVDPAHQRQGIGTALMLARLTMFDPNDLKTVMLLATELSRPFYERFGFIAEGSPSYDAIADYMIYSMYLTFTIEVAEQANAIISAMPVKFDLDLEDPNPPSP